MSIYDIDDIVYREVLLRLEGLENGQMHLEAGIRLKSEITSRIIYNLTMRAFYSQK